MLRSLEIQNFKGIKQGKIDDLAQVNILVGRNNSGKSTILDALVLLRCGLCGLDYLNINGLDQIIKRRVDRGQIDHGELWFRRDTSVPIGLSVEFAEGPKLAAEWGPYLEGTIWLGSNGEEIDKKSLDTYRWVIAKNNNSPRHPARTKVWQGLTEALGEAESAGIGLIHMVDALGIHYPFAENLWADLVKDRQDDKVRQILETVYGMPISYITAMRFPREERLVAALPHAGLAVDWLGDGFRYAVNILALGVLLKGTALLVEELETHQHPESLRKLTQALFELAKEQDLQLFLTTHSLELITYCLDVAEEKGIDLKLHHLSLDKEGTLRATSMSQPSAQLLLDIGHDPRLHYKYIGVE